MEAGKLKELSDAYDKLCKEEILPSPHMAHDPTRQVIDEAIAKNFGAARYFSLA